MKKLELWRRRAHHGATPSTPGVPAEPGTAAAQAAPSAATPGRSGPPSAEEEDTIPAAFYHSPD